MQNKILFIGLVLLMTASTQLNAQYAKQDSTYKKCFVGSTLFLIGNIDTRNSPDFVQLNLGYNLSGRDVISLELKT